MRLIDPRRTRSVQRGGGKSAESDAGGRHVPPAAADPASPVGFSGWLGLSPATLHLLVAVAAVGVNTWTHLVEYNALDENAKLIEQVMSEVQRIRDERGLDN